MNELLSGKTAIITGADSEIGRMTVEVLAREGANIWACVQKINAVEPNEMENIAQKYNVFVKSVCMDMKDETSTEHGIKEIIAEKPNVDILVNCSEVVLSEAFISTSIEVFRRMFELNFFSMVHITQLVSRYMIKQCRGVIVNLSADVDSQPKIGAYSASKAAVTQMTRGLAQELAPFSIRVNAVAPGIKTIDGVSNKLFSSTDMMATESEARRRRLEEAANIIAFLASDRASYITGQVIRVNGGV